MPEQQARRRLSPEQTKQLLDSYERYRFQQTLSPEDLAKKAGVKPEVTQRLIQQQPTDDVDLTRVAHVLGISAQLLLQICGLSEMSSEMLETLQRFMARSELPKARERGA